MPDGGRLAAFGFQYQYMRTLEALLASVEDDAVAFCRVEGEAASETLGSAEVVDFELLGADGQRLTIAQVKATSTSRVLTGPAAFEVLVRLVKSGSAMDYQLLTNQPAAKSLTRLTEALNVRDASPSALRGSLSSALEEAPRGLEDLRGLQDDELLRLRRAQVRLDTRSVEDVRSEIRRQVLVLRRSKGLGIGPSSSGLMVGFLLAEVLRMAADPKWAVSWPKDEFLRVLEAPDNQLVAELGAKDWGLVVGDLPPLPEVRRQAPFAQLESFLTSTQSQRVSRLLISGLSGLGKSTLVADYVADNLDRYDAVYWVDAGSAASLDRSYRLIGESLGQPVSGLGDGDFARQAVLQMLKSRGHRWLLVLDDATDLRALDAWLPSIGQGQVVITTTDSATALRADARVELGGLTLPECLELLQNRLNIDASQVERYRGPLLALSDALDRWPIALMMSVGYFKSCALDLPDLPSFTETLTARALADEVALPSGYPRTLPAILDLCLERVRVLVGRSDELSSLTDKALSGSAYLASRGIPVQVLASLAADRKEADASSRHPVLLDPRTEPVLEMVRALRSVSLVYVGEPLPLPKQEAPVPPGTAMTVHVNSVIQELLRARLDSHPMVSDLLEACCWTVERWLTASFAVGSAAMVERLLPHAQGVLAHAQRLGATSESLALLLGNLAAVERAKERHREARQLLEAELEVLGQLPDRNEFLELEATLHLADSLVSGDRADHERALNLVEGTFDALVRLSHGSEAARLNAVDLVLQVRELLKQPETRELDLRRTRLEEGYAALARTLPMTSVTNAVDALSAASEALSRGAPAEVLATCGALPDKGDLPWYIRHEAERLLIEADAAIGAWSSVDERLTRLAATADASVEPLIPQLIVDLVLNTGLAAALSWLGQGDRDARRVLRRLVEWPHARRPGLTADQRNVVNTRTLADAAIVESPGPAVVYAVLEQTASDSSQGRTNEAQRAEVWSLLKSLTLVSTSAVVRRAKALPVAAWRLEDLTASGMPGPMGTRIRLANASDAEQVRPYLRAVGPKAERHFDLSNQSHWFESVLQASFKSVESGRLQFATALTKGGFDAAVAACSSILVAEDEGQVVGVALLAPPADIILSASKATAGGQDAMLAQLGGLTGLVRLVSVLVEPSGRGHGIGTCLLKAGRRLYTRAGYAMLFGTIPAEWTDKPIEYSRLGLEVLAGDEPLNAWAVFGVHAALQAPPGGRIFVDRDLRRSGRSKGGGL